MKINQNIVTESTDKETGEVTTKHSTKTYYIKAKSEDFVIMFNSASNLISKDCTPTETKLLLSLFPIVEYNTNRLHITPQRRIELRELIGGEKILNNGSFSSALKGLLDKRIILVSEDNYILSPYFFWKGELSMRNKVLTVVLKEALDEGNLQIQ